MLLHFMLSALSVIPLGRYHYLNQHRGILVDTLYDWNGQGIHLFIYTMSWFLYCVFSRDALLLTKSRPDLFYKSSYFLCLAKAKFVFKSMGDLGGNIFIQQMGTQAW